MTKSDTGRYAKISCKIHGDRDFRALSETAKLVYLMVLTHPNMTSVGALPASSLGLADEFGIDYEAFAEAIKELLQSGISFKHSLTEFIVTIPNFFKHNAPESANSVIGMIRAANRLPDSDLVDAQMINLIAHMRAQPKKFTQEFAQPFKDNAHLLSKGFVEKWLNLKAVTDLPNPFETPPDPLRNPSETPRDSGTVTRTVTRTITRDKSKCANIPIDPLSFFDEFWSLYPRKRDKYRARLAWKRVVTTQTLVDAVMAHLKVRVTTEEWADQKFIPYPSTFLNGLCWEDDISPPKRKATSEDLERIVAQDRNDAFHDEIEKEKIRIAKLTQEQRDAETAITIGDGWKKPSEGDE